MRTCSILPVLAALALTITACQPQAGPLSAEDEAAIRDGAQSFVRAALAGDWAAAAATFTEDAIRMPPNAPIVEGRAAIQADEEESGAVLEDLTLTSVEIDGRDGLSYERGTYSITYTVPGIPEPMRDTGKYIAILRKQPDGSWLFAIDIWNSDLPLPE